MNEAVAHHSKFLHPHRVFTVFKWTIYVLLMWDTWYFLQEDLGSISAMFDGQVTLGNVTQAFSAFMDTLGWLILLLVFEFETAIIPDEMLQGALKWFLVLLKVACYFFIVSAFYGYVTEFMMYRGVAPFHLADVCTLADTGWNYVVTLDDYPELDAVSCLALQGQELFRVSDAELIGAANEIALAQRLTVIDVINASTWLLIVVVLEIEVRLQIRDALSDRLIRLSVWLKGILYSILFMVVIWWAIDGEFIDYWDASLWLIAFIFIELNIFQWHEEVESHHDSQAAAE